jgi:hypothetical protein
MTHPSTPAARTNARSRLATLREKKPPSKAAQIRALWPDIKAALDKGHSLKVVCECLAADDIALSEQSLSAYIWRIRRKAANTCAAPTSVPSTPQVVGDAPATASTEQPNDRARDPLANVRARQTKRTGFDYRPETADPKKLI